MYKQAILVRNDLKMPKGKMSAQVSHACLEAAFESDEEIVQKWRRDGAKKVVLKVDSKKDLMQYIRKAKNQGLVVSVIKDAGKTFLIPGTITCGGIGPCREEDLDNVCSDLKLI